jgi:hypothetical protein
VVSLHGTQPAALIEHAAIAITKTLLGNLKS